MYRKREGLVRNEPGHKVAYLFNVASDAVEVLDERPGDAFQFAANLRTTRDDLRKGEQRECNWLKRTDL